MARQGGQQGEKLTLRHLCGATCPLLDGWMGRREVEEVEAVEDRWQEGEAQKGMGPSECS